MRSKLITELQWGCLVAAATAVLQVLLVFHPEQITDWRIWAISAGAGVVRAAASAALGILAADRGDPPAPPAG